MGGAKEAELGCDEDRQWWRRYLEEVCRIEPAIAKMRDIGRRFAEMLRRRDAHALAGWLQQVQDSGVPELQRFASRIKADHDAVLAALSTPWSSGQVEGQINRLKYLKRQMYGRAHLDLLRIRVLHPA